MPFIISLLNAIFSNNNSIFLIDTPFLINYCPQGYLFSIRGDATNYAERRRRTSLMRGIRRRPRRKEIRRGLMGDLGVMGWMGEMEGVVVVSLVVLAVSDWVR